MGQTKFSDLDLDSVDLINAIKNSENGPDDEEVVNVFEDARVNNTPYTYWYFDSDKTRSTIETYKSSQYITTCQMARKLAISEDEDSDLNFELE